RVAAEIYAALAPALRQANAMDFDDLLLLPLTLFAEHPERLAYWQRRFDHVLVDEFQDTNAAQYRLVKQLAAEHRNLCVVGDDDQAIYGWRGADVRHMLSFQQDFPGTTLIKLEQNYRSTQVILDAANGVIAENPRRRIGDRSFASLARAAAQWRLPLLEAARAADRMPDLRPNVREAFASLVRSIDELRARQGQADPATALEQIVAAVGYAQYLADEGAEGIERLENVQELIAGAAEWAETAEEEEEEGGEQAGEGGNGGGATLIERYLTQAALVTSADQGTGDPTGVTLMTVHMAKGLEWPVVALAGLEDGLFPLARTAGEPGGLEEERRLCYVGLTRAREKLYLSWARTRYRNGRLELSAASRFLEAVPPSVLEERSTTPQWDRAGRGEAGRRSRRPLPVDLDWDVEVSQDAPRYVTGERVRHRKFGGGVVRAVAGSGRELKVTVEFD